MRRRIAVITDAHANLPALDAALAAIRADGPDAVYHTGDAIGIGPFPAEVLDRLLHEPGLRPVMGNHDAWFAFGLPGPRPPWMGEGELAHQRWVHAQLDPALRSVVATWPWVIGEEIGGVPVAFLHYALEGTGRGFADPISASDPAAMDRLFAPPRPAGLLRARALPDPDPAGGRRARPLRQPRRARLLTRATGPLRSAGRRPGGVLSARVPGRAVRPGPALRCLSRARGAGAGVHQGDVLRLIASHREEVCGHTLAVCFSTSRLLDS